MWTQEAPVGSCQPGPRRLRGSDLRFDIAWAALLRARSRTEVGTEVVSAVRARESRLARSRFKQLRVRVPHEDAVSTANKVAQRVEQRFKVPSVVGSTPALVPTSL